MHMFFYICTDGVCMCTYTYSYYLEKFFCMFLNSIIAFQWKIEASKYKQFVYMKQTYKFHIQLYINIFHKQLYMKYSFFFFLFFLF